MFHCQFSRAVNTDHGLNQSALMTQNKRHVIKIIERTDNIPYIYFSNILVILEQNETLIMFSQNRMLTFKRLICAQTKT